MLALSRKEGERILIDGGIEIAILRCKGGTVRVGISAPAETEILRAELLDPPKDQRPLGGQVVNALDRVSDAQDARQTNC